MQKELKKYLKVNLLFVASMNTGGGDMVLVHYHVLTLAAVYV